MLPILPLDQEIFKPLEKFVVPFVQHKLHLKETAGRLRYSNERTGESYEVFASYLPNAVTEYMECKVHVREYAYELNNPPKRPSYEDIEREKQMKKLYWDRVKDLEDAAHDLLCAIQFINAHQLIDDASEKKIEELENRRKECAANLATARLRIAQLETFMRVHGLNPYDANDTIVSDPYEGGDNDQHD